MKKKVLGEKKQKNKSRRQTHIMEKSVCVREKEALKQQALISFLFFTAKQNW